MRPHNNHFTQQNPLERDRNRQDGFQGVIREFPVDHEAANQRDDKWESQTEVIPDDIIRKGPEGDYPAPG